MPGPTVALHHNGLLIGDELVPLHAGAMHYWRHDPAAWRPCLEAMVSMGFRLVDVYVPWAVHEVAKNEFDFGASDPRRDVAAMMRLAHSLGLYVICRPGPHINAEMTLFGLPARVVWKGSCQAKTPEGNPVMLPSPPLAFPVPSFASESFLKETKRYFDALGAVLGPLCYPDGPIVMVQVDNEGSLYFRDGAYDQDYHPDAVALYRKMLAHKYGPEATPRSVYGMDVDSFAKLAPPLQFEARTAEDLARHLDWSQLHEHMVTRFMRRVGKRLRKAGFKGIPTSHNVPMAEHTSPASMGAIGEVVDLVGLDSYYAAGPASRRVLARRMSYLAARCDAQDKPAFACEQGAGFPPFFPPMDECENAFNVMTSLAYGLRGFNVYMAVERDRWIGAPIDSQGRIRPSAQFWTELMQMLTRTSFASLRRDTPVRLIVPRSVVRLGRVMNAFGPVSGAAFAVVGAGAQARCFDDTFETGESIAIAAEAFVEAFEAVLEVRGIPHAFGSDDDLDASLHGARWAVVAAPAGAVDLTVMTKLEQFVREGGCVSFGPTAPARDAILRPLEAIPDVLSWPSAERVPTVVAASSEAIESAVEQASAELNLPVVQCEPPEVFATVHRDMQGVARMLFVINPTRSAVEARVRVENAASVVDAMRREAWQLSEGWAGHKIPALGVVALELGAS